MLLSLLEMFHGERSQFRSPEAASQEDSNHGVVTLATKIPIVEDCKKSLPLFSSQPVSNPHAVFLDAFHASDACREIRTEKSAIRGLVNRKLLKHVSDREGKQRESNLQSPIAA